MGEIKRSTFQATARQAHRLEERRKGEPIEIMCCGLSIVVNLGVYQTAEDSELMVESVELSGAEDFLEIGCGTGVVSIALAKKAARGVAVDINEKAVENSKRNAERHDITNVDFLSSDVFENVQGKFDVIICNPPYTNHEIKDDIDRMFWDPKDQMKRRFFKEVGNYLKSGGRIYFGWADFADIDVDLPLTLAEANRYKLVHTYSKPRGNDFTFYVFEFIQTV